MTLALIPIFRIEYLPLGQKTIAFSQGHATISHSIIVLLRISLLDCDLTHLTYGTLVQPATVE